MTDFPPKGNSDLFVESLERLFYRHVCFSGGRCWLLGATIPTTWNVDRGKWNCHIGWSKGPLRSHLLGVAIAICFPPGCKIVFLVTLHSNPSLRRVVIACPHLSYVTPCWLWWPEPVVVLLPVLKQCCWRPRTRRNVCHGHAGRTCQYQKMRGREMGNDQAWIMHESWMVLLISVDLLTQFCPSWAWNWEKLTLQQQARRSKKELSGWIVADYISSNITWKKKDLPGWFCHDFQWLAT